MLSSLKRYSVALVILLIIVVLMLAGTLLVTSFGENMFEELNVTMKPKGEHIEL